MANKEITLPSGATVIIRDPLSIKQKDRARIYASVPTEGTPSLAQANTINENVMAIIIDSWSLDLIPPSVKIDSLGELSLADYDALQEEVENIMPALFPRIGKTVENEANPKANTDSSSD